MLLVNELLCDLCATCAGVCPKNCIEVFENKMRIDYEECIECLNCVAVCPFEAIQVKSGEVKEV